MKNILLLITLSLFVFGSCKKETLPEIPEQNITQPKEITVDYVIYGASGKLNVVALVSENGVLAEKNFEINRINHKITFTTMSQQEIMVKATNADPSHSEVMVTIYVDGLLFKSNSTTEAAGWAIANGIPQ